MCFLLQSGNTQNQSEMKNFSVYLKYLKQLLTEEEIIMNIGNATHYTPTIEDFIQWLDYDYDKERKQISEEAKGLSEEELHHTKLLDDNNELNKSYKLIRGAAEKLKQFENEWGKNEEKKDKKGTIRKGILSKLKFEDMEDANSEEDGKVGIIKDTHNYEWDNYGFDGVLDEMANREIPPSHL